MSFRKGPWLLTYSGGRYYPLDPRPEDYCIADVAHHTSLVNRYGGGTMVATPVASHATVGSFLVPREKAYPFHMHDGDEAYYPGDRPGPVKARPAGGHELAEHELRDLEHRKHLAFCEAFGLPIGFDEDEDVKTADHVMLATESRCLRSELPSDDPLRASGAVGAASFEMVRWSAFDAEVAFLCRYADLTGADVSLPLAAAVMASQLNRRYVDVLRRETHASDAVWTEVYRAIEWWARTRVGLESLMPQESTGEPKGSVS